MKNKGLMTRPASGISLINHKSPRPEELPNRVDADNKTETTVQQTPQKNEAQSPSQSTPRQRDVAPTDHNKNASSPSRSASSDERRYTLKLSIENTTHELLQEHLERIPEKSRPAAKRALIRSFRRHLITVPPKKSKFKPKNPVGMRIDLKLPTSMKEAIFNAEKALVFEAERTVLARNIAPVLEEYLLHSLQPK